VLEIDLITAPKQIRKIASYAASSVGDVDQGEAIKESEEDAGQPSETAEDEVSTEAGDSSLDGEHNKVRSDQRKGLEKQLSSIGLMPGLPSWDDTSERIIEEPNAAVFLLDSCQLMGLSSNLKDVSMKWEAVSEIGGFLLGTQSVTVKFKREKAGIWLSTDPVELNVESDCDLDSCLRVTVYARRCMPVGIDRTGSTKEGAPKVIVSRATIDGIERHVLGEKKCVRLTRHMAQVSALSSSIFDLSISFGMRIDRRYVSPCSGGQFREIPPHARIAPHAPINLKGRKVGLPKEPAPIHLHSEMIKRAEKQAASVHTGKGHLEVSTGHLEIPDEVECKMEGVENIDDFFKTKKIPIEREWKRHPHHRDLHSPWGFKTGIRMGSPGKKMRMHNGPVPLPSPLGYREVPGGEMHHIHAHQMFGETRVWEDLSAGMQFSGPHVYIRTPGRIEGPHKGFKGQQHSYQHGMGMGTRFSYAPRPFASPVRHAPNMPPGRRTL